MNPIWEHNLMKIADDLLKEAKQYQKWNAGPLALGCQYKADVIIDTIEEIKELEQRLGEALRRKEQEQP